MWCIIEVHYGVERLYKRRAYETRSKALDDIQLDSRFKGLSRKAVSKAAIRRGLRIVPCRIAWHA